MKRKLNLPRVPLPRQRGGAHQVNRELSAREDLTLRLNELAQEEFEDAEEFRQQLEAVISSTDYDEQNEEDYFDFLLERIDATGTWGRMH